MKRVEGRFKVAEVGSLAIGGALLAIASAAGAIAVAFTSDRVAGAIFLGLVSLTSLIAAVLFQSLRRVELATATEVLGEAVVAQGIGRGGAGLLGAHVVVVTPRKVVAVPAWPLGAADPDTAIDLADVKHLAVDEQSIAVAGSHPPLIQLKKCSPTAVRELEIAIRSGMRNLGVDSRT